jgi:hypothetical protein
LVRLHGLFIDPIGERAILVAAIVDSDHRTPVTGDDNQSGVKSVMLVMMTRASITSFAASW